MHFASSPDEKCGLVVLPELGSDIEGFAGPGSAQDYSGLRSKANRGEAYNDGHSAAGTSSTVRHGGDPKGRVLASPPVGELALLDPAFLITWREMRARVVRQK